MDIATSSWLVSVEVVVVWLTKMPTSLYSAHTSRLFFLDLLDCEDDDDVLDLFFLFYVCVMWVLLLSALLVAF